MRPDTAFTVQNMPSENQDLYVPFCYETDTTLTLENTQSENQDLYVPFCNQTTHCLYFAGHALRKSRFISGQAPTIGRCPSLVSRKKPLSH